MKKFPKQDLLDLLDGDSDILTLVSDDVVDTSRWSVIHDLVFKDQDGTVYITDYSKGATEYQDEGPWEHDGDEIECHEAVPVQKTVYERKKP